MMSCVSTTEPIPSVVLDDDKTESSGNESDNKLVRIRKNKFAVFLSYCGAGYNGLQRNPGYPTIEEEVLKALLKSNHIDDQDFTCLGRIHFQRAARTDKGVSAAVQVLSLKLPSEFSEDQVEQLNQHLPPEIRVVGAIKSTKYFDAKNFCDGRTYSYIMPTFALAPPDALTSEDYRLTPDILKEFRNVLDIYKGTHNYHNFTSGKESTDPSARRHIVSIESSEPFMKDGLEVIIVRIRGQSFMLHQIRKMIGTVIAVMRGFATVDTLKQTFQLDKMDLPRAPGLGLMLEDVHYDRYNKRFGGDGIHEKLEWSRWAEKVNEFKQKSIYPIMMRTEKQDKSMLNWLQVLPFHTYQKRECLPGGHVKIDQEARTDWAAALIQVSDVKKLQEKEGDTETDGQDDDGAPPPQENDESIVSDNFDNHDEPPLKKVREEAS